MNTQLCTKCGKAIEPGVIFCPGCGTKQTQEVVKSPHSGVTAWVLCIFLGHFGAHRFYVGKYLTAILMFLTFGGLGIWYVYDYFSIPCKNFTDAQGRYLECQHNKVLPVIMTCLFTLIILFYILIFTLVGVSEYHKTELRDMVSKQVTALQENKLDEAYSYEYTDTITQNDFNDFIKRHPEFEHSQSIKFPTSDYNDVDHDSAKLEAQLISPAGEKTIIHYEFKKQNNEWKIIKTEVNPDSPVSKEVKEESKE